MQAFDVDERDSRWERHDPRYRLYTFDSGGVTRTVDLVDASLRDAMWSGEIAGRSGMLWSLALVVDDTALGRGLTWISGLDYHDTPSTPAMWRERAVMQDRWLSASGRSDPPTLPDGKRVIRLSCDHGVEWPLQESSTAEHTRTPEELGVSGALRDRLRSWLESFHAGETDEAWTAEGERLHGLLQEEVAAVAEVRSAFAPGMR